MLKVVYMRLRLSGLLRRLAIVVAAVERRGFVVVVVVISLNLVCVNIGLLHRLAIHVAVEMLII